MNITLPPRSFGLVPSTLVRRLSPLDTRLSPFGSRPSALAPWLVCLLITFVGGSSLLGAPEQGWPVKVQGLLGRAQFSRDGKSYQTLESGMSLHAGDVVRTASSSALDLDLGEGPGTVRLTQETVLSLDKVMRPDKAGDPYEVELGLRTGELLAQTKGVPAEARYEIKTANGIVRVLRGQFRIQAQSYLVLLEGKILFAHVPSGGEPTAHNLNAPPPCYFTPGSGVKPAPKALVGEVTKQFRGKLPH